ncbi:MAG: hypothetical protein RSB72_02720, partial [Bacilli bacterium]
KEIIKTIDITVTKINKVLGTNIAKSEIISIFKKLDFNPTSNQELITVTVPSRRMDINIKEDLIEEIGRIYGMDNIQGKLPKLALKPGRFNQTNRLIKNKMISLGLNETLSYTLISKDNIKKFTTDDFIKIEIALPMSEEHTTLRYSLLNSLLEIYEYNKAHKSKDICIFEMGNGFFKEGNEYKQELKIACLMTGNYYMGIKKEPVDFYIIKGVVEELLDYLGYKYTFESSCLVKELHPGQSANIIVNKQRIGIIGKIHPSICSDNVFVCEINLSKLLMINTSKMKYQEISKYPEVNKDLAFIVDKKITSETIEKVIKRAGGKTLTKIAVFDVYEGEKVK